MSFPKITFLLIPKQHCCYLHPFLPFHGTDNKLGREISICHGLVKFPISAIRPSPRTTSPTGLGMLPESELVQETPALLHLSYALLFGTKGWGNTKGEWGSLCPAAQHRKESQKEYEEKSLLDFSRAARAPMAALGKEERWRNNVNFFNNFCNLHLHSLLGQASQMV